MKALTPIFAIVWIVATIWFISMRINFNQNCLGYLRQASDANTIELAMDRLGKALEYIEEKGWTDGYTSIVWKTEDENVGFWYANLKASYKELANALDATQLEQTNVLMKLRETLTEQGEKGVHITYPSGLWKHPHNSTFALIIWIVNILGFFALVGISLIFENL